MHIDDNVPNGPIRRRRRRIRSRWTANPVSQTFTPLPDDMTIAYAHVSVSSLLPGDILAKGHVVKEIVPCGQITDVQFVGELTWRTFKSAESVEIARQLA